VPTILRIRDRLQAELMGGGKLLGLFNADITALWHGGNLEEPRIQHRVEARRLARLQRNFAEADRIRDELAAEGFILEDKPDGTTTWLRG